ncbi:hypothetical protein ACA910_022322 [Epithemia clementina (nom. ined.)]
MLSGGSEAARGIPLRGARNFLRPGETLQTVYETRFITYLARFLLNFDPAANSWWTKQGFVGTWDSSPDADDRALVENKFAEFAESVEVGLADYFVGPYGSYSSLSAARAGISAANPAPSLQPTERRGLFEKVIFGSERVSDQDDKASNTKAARQGILNLLTLLQARYTSLAAKRQLAILFSFIKSPQLQPSDQICGLLGEADNATISQITIEKSTLPYKEATSRISARLGGGYSLGTFPTVTVDSPPPLGDKFRPAIARPVMRVTSRVLQINVIDGGEGYSSPPQVSVLEGNMQRPCQAVAIINRRGNVDSVIVLDPGYGYGLSKEVPPKIMIDPPKKPRGNQNVGKDQTFRRARAYADLEYEIVGVDIVSGGSGYLSYEPPSVTISPPVQDPDWFIAVQELPELRMQPLAEKFLFKAKVTEMKYPDGNVAFSINNSRRRINVDGSMIRRIQRDPLEMLPSSVRPERLIKDREFKNSIYTIPLLDAIPQDVADVNPLYRAQDPIFGGIGVVPVTKGARTLTPSEYARLALSGGICTVFVRTILNPLELVKTKQQLKNDAELFTYAASQARNLNVDPPTIALEDKPFDDDAEMDRIAAGKQVAPTKTEKVGVLDILRGLVSLRGVSSLFQSADITFLSSLVFGTFGFGATELFRRSFAAVFSDQEAGAATLGNEVTLLLAATVATIITSAVASPFEVLRVRSMGLLEDKSLEAVFKDFLMDSGSEAVTAPDDELDWRKLKPRDFLPVWTAFNPILSREIPFVVTKFVAFDVISTSTVAFLNSQAGEGALPVQIGVGGVGLAVSAASGAIAGVAGAVISHPADLIITKVSAQSGKQSKEADESAKGDWRSAVKDMISQEGGIANLFVGLPARASFFFLVIGLQFFLYDYVKGIFQVSSDDLSLVLDVFYSVRAGLAAAN